MRGFVNNDLQPAVVMAEQEGAQRVDARRRIPATVPQVAVEHQDLRGGERKQAIQRRSVFTGQRERNRLGNGFRTRRNFRHATLPSDRPHGAGATPPSAHEMRRGQTAQQHVIHARLYAARTTCGAGCLQSIFGGNLGIVPAALISGIIMRIFKDTVVTLNYSLLDPDGELIEKSSEPITYLHGGYGNIFPKVEEALGQKQDGDKVSIVMEPDEAFGEYDEELVRVEDTSKFPPSIKVGDQFEGVADGGDEHDTVVYTITDIAEGLSLIHISE